MSVKIRPLGDRVIVEPVEEDEMTFAGGQLVLPDTAKEKPQQGSVLAVGPDVEVENEDGKYLDANGVPTYNVKQDGTVAHSHPLTDQAWHIRT